MQQQQQVLIVGAGPTGLVSALTLLKSGISVRIIDKALEHHVSSRGAAVMSRIQEIEHFLGTLRDLKAVSAPVPRVLVYDPENPGQVKHDATFIEPVDATPQMPIAIPILVNQYLHEEVLRSHVEAHGGNIELGTELSALEQDESGVTAHLTKLVDGKQVHEMASFSYVIGADGGHSTVRRSLGLQFIGQTYEEERLLNADGDLRGLKGYGMHFFTVNPSLDLAFRPTNDPERFQILITGHGYVEIAQECINAGPEEFQTILRRLTKMENLELLKIYTKTEWKYNARVVDHFQKGRVFVAGDAAHAHSPMGGQGMTSSIQDAFNLAWKLALVLKGHASPKLLESYEEERLPCIADMLLESSKLHRLMYGEKTKSESDTKQDVQKQAGIQKIIDALGSAVAPISDVSAATEVGKNGELDTRWFRSRKLSQIDLNYRWSSIIYDERFAQADSDTSSLSKKDAYGKVGHELRAGDRAPDAPDLLILRDRAPVGKVSGKQGEVIHLFDTFDPTVHTALIFAFDVTFSAKMRNAWKRLPQGFVRSLVILPQAATSSIGKDVGLDLILNDKEGHAYQGYNIDRDVGTVVVVRPDGMVGAFATSVTGVERYFAKIFSLQ